MGRHGVDVRGLAAKRLGGGQEYAVLLFEFCIGELDLAQPAAHLFGHVGVADEADEPAQRQAEQAGDVDPERGAAKV